MQADNVIHSAAELYPKRYTLGASFQTSNKGPKDALTDSIPLLK